VTASGTAANTAPTEANLTAANVTEANVSAANATAANVTAANVIAANASSFPTILKTVIPAKAGTYNPPAVPRCLRGSAAIQMMPKFAAVPSPHRLIPVSSPALKT